MWETGVEGVLEARPQSSGFLLCEKEGPLKGLSRKISGSDLYFYFICALVMDSKTSLSCVVIKAAGNKDQN